MPLSLNAAQQFLGDDDFCRLNFTFLKIQKKRKIFKPISGCVCDSSSSRRTLKHTRNASKTRKNILFVSFLPFRMYSMLVHRGVSLAEAFVWLRKFVSPSTSTILVRALWRSARTRSSFLSRWCVCVFFFLLSASSSSSLVLFVHFLPLNKKPQVKKISCRASERALTRIVWF